MGESNCTGCVNITNETAIDGGATIEGVLVDNAEQSVELPEHSSRFWKTRSYKRKTVGEVRIDGDDRCRSKRKKILILDSLQNEGQFGLVVNARSLIPKRIFLILNLMGQFSKTSFG